MKSSTGVRNLPDNKWQISDVFHELRSTLAGILSSVELMELYATKPDSGEKIARQAVSVKMQVIELELQLQNVKLMQDAANSTLRLHLAPVNLLYTMEAFIQDERYAFLFGKGVSFHTSSKEEVAYVDEMLVKQMVLNMAYLMMRHGSESNSPSLNFSFEEEQILISGRYITYLQGNTQYADQRLIQLITLIAEMNGGTFEMEVQEGKNVEMTIRIPCN